MSLNLAEYEFPTERADVSFASRGVLPVASEPTILHSDQFALAADVPEKLQRLGFDAQQANGFAVVVRNTIEVEGFAAEDRKILGLQKGDGCISEGEDGQELYHPLSVSMSSGLGLQAANHIVLHELGHELFGAERKRSGREAGYHDERKIRIIECIGKALLPMNIRLNSRAILWRLSKEERQCERFARKNAKVQLLVDKSI
jgi:hypothetical protein